MYFWKEIYKTNIKCLNNVFLKIKVNIKSNNSMTIFKNSQNYKNTKK